MCDEIVSPDNKLLYRRIGIADKGDIGLQLSRIWFSRVRERLRATVAALGRWNTSSPRSASSGYLRETR
jgi:hypothetical protein